VRWKNGYIKQDQERSDGIREREEDVSQAQHRANLN